MPIPPDVSNKLEWLRQLLSALPPKTHPSGSTYPFEGFLPDEEWTELTGTVQGSVNHSLEVAFGCQAKADGSPIEFISHGTDLLAVVDVLATHITGHDGENPILIKWVSDLQNTAISAGSLGHQHASSKQVPKKTEKRVHDEELAAAKSDKKRKKDEENSARERAKAWTEGNFTFNPELLIEEPAAPSTKGRKPVSLLNELTIRCIIKGCEYLSSDLVEKAAAASAGKSLGSKLESMNASRPSNSAQPSVHLVAQSEGREQRNMRYNHLALLAICGLSLPLTILDSRYWRNMIEFLDPKIAPSSASHVAAALIPSEAARVRQKSIEVLQGYRHLTLSFDGATTRRNQSIYTVHATTPDTRQSHLLAGSNATGKSHTGQHLREVLVKTLKLVGADCYSAVTSDSARNTRLAKELLADDFPWLIIFPDSCHQMNNTAKDICSLEIFAETNSKLRIVIRYFRRSSHASHHLTALRIIYRILIGLISISKTRFRTWYYAIKPFLPYLAPILDLIKSQVILVKPGHPLYWMRDKQAVRAFEDSLRLEMALLELFARSVKCLESSASTPADICLFWLACQATLNDIFTDSDKQADLMISEDTIGDVRAIVNGRFSGMFDGSNHRMYISTLFLDP
ncbi:hypothetical protein FRC06_009372, partial [Ceratobasidium sp. 370]